MSIGLGWTLYYLHLALVELGHVFFYVTGGTILLITMVLWALSGYVRLLVETKPKDETLDPYIKKMADFNLKFLTMTEMMEMMEIQIAEAKKAEKEATKAAEEAVKNKNSTEQTDTTVTNSAAPVVTIITTLQTYSLFGRLYDSIKTSARDWYVKRAIKFYAGGLNKHVPIDCAICKIVIVFIQFDATPEPAVIIGALDGWYVYSSRLIKLS